MRLLTPSKRSCKVRNSSARSAADCSDIWLSRPRRSACAVTSCAAVVVSEPKLSYVVLKLRFCQNNKKIAAAIKINNVAVRAPKKISMQRSFLVPHAVNLDLVTGAYYLKA